MWSDSDDSKDRDTLLANNFITPRMPKDAIGSGSVVLSKGLYPFLTVGAAERGELVRIKSRMIRVGLKGTEGLLN